MLERLTPLLPRIRRALRRRRRMLTLLLIAVLAAMFVPGMLPASMRTADVVVTAHAVPAGSVLATSDLDTRRVALPLRPEGSVSDSTELTGTVLGRDLAAGEVVVPATLTVDPDTPELAGKAVMAVPVDPQLLGRLAPGDDLHLIVSQPVDGPTSPITATVIEVPNAPDTDALGVSSSAHGVQILVAVQPSSSGSIAHALHEGWLGVALIA